jgi:hypothetical protein
MLVNGKWTTDWQPVQSQDEKGQILTSNIDLSQLGHP